MTLRVAMAIGWLLASPAASQEIPAAEYAARRGRLLDRFPKGIVLLHARATEAGLLEHGFKQDAAFLYFTGLSSQPAAILALDGPKRESVLFVPEAPISFGMTVEGVSLAPGAQHRGFDRVVDWSELGGFLSSRLSEGVETLYVDESRRPVMPGNPDGFWPMAGERTLWRRALEEKFPHAEIGSAAAAIREMRWVKSASEVAALRQVARASASALLAGIGALRPGARQRASEVAVVSGCIEAGAEGPSFWPWTMSGPNADPAMLVRSFYDYRHLDREMQEGELVRMDVGCDHGHYEGDVGRTVPVSGRFDPEQAEAWDLLIRAYRAGLAAMRAGRTHAEIAEASRRAVRDAEPSLQTDYARSAARAMIEGGDSLWHLHGVGLEAGEERLPRLEAGSVVAYEPGFAVGEDAFYLEDMILITESGHEVLSRGLPYTSDEIAEVMSVR